MDRMKDIEIFINTEIEDSFHKLLGKYKNQLEGYNYIESLQDFSVLPLKGSMRYINKFSKELRYGGLLVKIYEKNNFYFAMIKKMNGKIYHVSYNNNFIFYMKSSNDSFRDSLSCFISDFDRGLYD